MKSRPETASIEFAAIPKKPNSSATMRPSKFEIEVDSRERSGAELQRAGLRLGEREARTIAREHPEVSEQMVPEVDGLRVPQMRVSGHRPVHVLLGACGQRGHQLSDRGSRKRRAYIIRSVTTWSSRERAVCRRPATGPTISPSRRSIPMWMSPSAGLSEKRPSRISRSTSSSPRSSVSLSRARLCRGHRACARARASRDVLGPQSPIDVDRYVRRWKSASWARGSATPQEVYGDAPTATRRRSPLPLRCPQIVAAKDFAGFEETAASRPHGQPPKVPDAHRRIRLGGIVGNNGCLPQDT